MTASDMAGTGAAPTVRKGGSTVALMAAWCGWYLSTLYVGGVGFALGYLYLRGAFDELNWRPVLVPFALSRVGYFILRFILVPSVVAGWVIATALRRPGKNMGRIFLAWLIATFFLEAFLCYLFYLYFNGGFWGVAMESRMHPSVSYIVVFEFLCGLAFPIASLILTISGYFVARRVVRSGSLKGGAWEDWRERRG